MRTPRGNESLADPLTFRSGKEKAEYFRIRPFPGGGLKRFRTLLWDQSTPIPRIPYRMCGYAPLLRDTQTPALAPGLRILSSRSVSASYSEEDSG